MNTKKIIYLMMMMLVLSLFTGCINIEKSKADLIIEECVKTGKYNDKSYCENEQCADGVPYFVGIVCAQESAKDISKTDKNIAKEICDKWAEIDKLQFKDNFIMVKMPSMNLVNCYLKTGNEEYQAEAMCIQTDAGSARDTCIKMAQSQLEIRNNSNLDDK